MGSRSCSNSPPAELFSERATENMASTSEVEGTAAVPPTLPTSPSSPLLVTVEWRFS